MTWARPRPTCRLVFFRKLTHDIENAKQQLNAYSTETAARKIVYIIVNFDDDFHEYKDMYEEQITVCLNTDMFPEGEIIFDIKPPFYTARN